jgi:glycosyltransferase involved in cell wall biosynthesis
MRVAIVSFDFGEYCVRLASALAQHVEVMLALPETEADPYLYMLDSEVSLVKFPKPRLRHVLNQVKLQAHLFSEIRAFKPDVAHLQSAHFWFNLALPALGRIPLVTTVHDAAIHPGDRLSSKTPQWLVDAGFKKAKRLFVHAAQQRQTLIDRLDIPGEKIHVIPMVLCGDDRVHLDVREDENTVLFFGRIWEYKGLDYLIRAEPLITAKIPSVRFVIAGKGEDLCKYKEMMVNPERFTVYEEYVSDSQRAELFRRASVVALPYIEASQSGVIPIAYRFGKPVVATTVGGLPALVDDGRTGYLVPPRNEHALAAAIVKLLENKALRVQMGAAGRIKINSECSPEVVARLTVPVYRKAITGGQAGGGRAGDRSLTAGV